MSKKKEDGHFDTFLYFAEELQDANRAIDVLASALSPIQIGELATELSKLRQKVKEVNYEKEKN